MNKKYIEMKIWEDENKMVYKIHCGYEVFFKCWTILTLLYVMVNIVDLSVKKRLFILP